MVTDDRWQRIETLVGEARALPPEERDAFLGRACDDPTVRDEVDRLLTAGDEVGDRFERPAGAASASPGGVKPEMPERIGAFRITGILGEGGMGSVYVGERADGEFRQRVAIKLVRRDAPSDEMRRRFRHERQHLADLEHPNIARLLDGGTTPAGEPYVVMELVAGESIDLYCDRRRLTVDDRLRLMRLICAALHYAHERRIVHRDLKPSNILVTADGKPKLLDFGIAKLLDPEAAVDHTVTGAWQRALTPAYASPEQVEGGEITAATDVYGLGLLLYHLLTGRPAQTVAGGDLLRAVCEREPPPPSRAVRGDAVAAARGTTPRRLARRLAGDLDQIVSKALRKQPLERYDSAEALGADLDRHLADRPVAARRANLRYRTAKLLRRHRSAAAAALAATVVAAAGFAGLALLGERRDAVENPGRFVARRAVAVAGFHDLAGTGQESAWLGSALGELIAGELGAGESLRVLPGSEVVRARAELALGGGGSLPVEAVGRLARGLDADLVVHGSYLRLGAGTEARLRIDCTVAGRAGATLVRLTETGREDELFELVARLGARLRAGLGAVALSHAQERELSASSPGNLQAGRLYASGLAALRRFDARTARDLLAEAVAADPDYPLAHAALADAWQQLGYDRRAREQAARAFELATDLPRAERLAIEARHHETSGRWVRAIETYRTLATLFPDDPEPLLRLAAAQTAAGRAGEALWTVDHLRRMIAAAGRDPRVDLAEADAAGALSDFPHQQRAAGRAAAAGRAREAPLLVARALLTEWWALRNLGRLEEALARTAEARELFAAAGDGGGVARALNATATVLADQGRIEEAIEADLEALEIFRRLEDRRRMSWSLNNIGRNLRSRGDLAGARRMYEESLAICREIGDLSCTARGQANLGRMLLAAGDLAAARELHRESLRLRREIGEARGIAGATVDLAVVQLAEGDLATAAEGFHAAAADFLDLGDKQSAAHSFGFLGTALLARGELTAARTAHERALALRTELGARTAGRSRLALAEVALAEGRPEQAAEALERLLVGESLDDLGADAALARALLATALLELGDVAGARRANAAAHVPSIAELGLGERLEVTILIARVAEILAPNGSGALDRAVEEARAVGLREPELTARLFAGELALRRGERTGRPELESLAAEAEAAGFGRVAARARALLAEAPFVPSRESR